MAKYTFDTSFIISNELSDYPDNFYFSEVVLLEFMGSAKDETELKKYQAARREHKKDGTLITPDSDDWLMASKILFWLEQGKMKANKGNSPPKKPGATQRMALDALIAAGARRYGVTVVTENWKDFNAIQYYCKFQLLKGKDFLDKFNI